MIGRMMTRLSILLVDDHAFFRDTLRRFLVRRDDVAIVGEAADGLEALRLVEQLRPRLVLMDIHMPRLDGIAACRAIRAEYPDTKVILYSGHRDALLAAREAHVADGDLLKEELFQALPACLERWTARLADQVDSTGGVSCSE
jgi:DNA-binding NarL/FixJ family response regulator